MNKQGQEVFKKEEMMSYIWLVNLCDEICMFCATTGLPARRPRENCLQYFLLPDSFVVIFIKHIHLAMCSMSGKFELCVALV